MDSEAPTLKSRSDHYLGRIGVLEEALKLLMSNMTALNEAQRVIDSCHSQEARLKACDGYILEVHAGYTRLKAWALDGVDEAMAELDVMKAALREINQR